MAANLPKPLKKEPYNFGNFLCAMLILADVPLFITLAVAGLDSSTNLLIIAIYSIATLPAIYVLFVYHYKKHEMNRDEYRVLTKIEDYKFKRIFLYLVPIIFGIVIINYVTTYYNQPILIFQPILDRISEPSGYIPGLNGLTFGIVLLVFLSHYGYSTALPSSVAEFKFFLAGEYLEKAKNEISQPKKINLFIRSLDYYDKYMRKKFKHKIDKNRIFSKLMTDSKLIIDEKFKELLETFGDSNKLSPLQKMSYILDNERPDELLARISKFDTFKESIDSIISVISVAIAILGLAFGIK